MAKRRVLPYLNIVHKILCAYGHAGINEKAGEMMSYLAENKKAYHVVKGDELQLVSGTEHHGGICLLVKNVRR